MRISDWSSDVCSSDLSHADDEASQLFAQIRGRTQLLSAAYRLQRLALERGKPDAERERGYQQRDEPRIKAALEQATRRFDPKVEKALLAGLLERHRALPASQHIDEIEIGRASCRERVCQYV